MLATAKGLLTLAGNAQVFAADRLPTGLAAADLIALGVVPSATSNAAAAAVLSAVSAHAVNAVDSLAEVQAVANLAIKAQAKISAYADDASRPAPVAADYLAVGLVKSDGTALVGSDNLGAINTTLASTAITGALAGDPAKLKGIVDAYAHIVAATLAGTVAPSLADYTAVGLSGLNLQNKSLLDGALPRLPTAADLKLLGIDISSKSLAQQGATLSGAGINNGQTTIVQNQAMGWYWVPQKLDSMSGGAGDDQIQLAVTAGGANTVVQTGQGKDTLMLGGFGTTDSSRLVATVSDFTLGQDKVKVFGQNVTKDNLNTFATASAYNTSSTKLVVDLDGAGAGTTSYTLYLQNVAYNPSNTHTIFGV